MKRVIAMLLLATLPACSPTTYAFTAASNRPLSPRPENCAIEVASGNLQKDYEELGVLDHYNGDVPKDLDKFKKAVHKQVCQAGGDAVIAIANENGRFAKGSVVKFTGPMAEPVKPLSTPTPVQQATDTEAMPKK